MYVHKQQRFKQFIKKITNLNAKIQIKMIFVFLAKVMNVKIITVNGRYPSDTIATKTKLKLHYAFIDKKHYLESDTFVSVYNSNLHLSVNINKIPINDALICWFCIKDCKICNFKIEFNKSV